MRIILMATYIFVSCGHSENIPSEGHEPEAANA
jgi:hypothetical protein